jgi:hypothetical protein
MIFEVADLRYTEPGLADPAPEERSRDVTDSVGATRWAIAG